MKVNGRFLRIFTAVLVLNVSIFLSRASTIESETDDAGTVSTIEIASEGTEELPPLIVDTSSLLLLDEPTECDGAVNTNTEATIKNTVCFVCHANYITESLASRHAGVNIGCVHCHGLSTAHWNDENKTTPPEVMYSKEKIGPVCRGCHSSVHDIYPKTIIARWQKRS